MTTDVSTRPIILRIIDSIALIAMFVFWGLAATYKTPFYQIAAIISTAILCFSQSMHRD